MTLSGLTKEEIKGKIEGNQLDLSLLDLKKVPLNEIASFTKVTSLDLSCNQLRLLPDRFGVLSRIVELDLSRNQLESLPESFGQLVNLRRLDLMQNRIDTLPLSFSQLSNLSWLDLKGNPIQQRLPEVVSDCLEPEECRQCAKNVVGYMLDLMTKEYLAEKKRQDKLKAQQKTLQEREEHDRELRKRQRKEEKKRTPPSKISPTETEPLVLPAEDKAASKEMLRGGSGRTICALWSAVAIFALAVTVLWLTGVLFDSYPVGA